MNFHAEDINRMKLALALAEGTRGQTWPNPLVGAVVVKNGEIVGVGAHLKAGTPHAEVHALQMAGSLAAGSTVYVTLEPCSHYGRTPPCADLLIEKGVKRVIMAMVDPHERVAGQGIAKLRAAGLEVVVGVLEEEARKLNEAFVTFITKRRPFTLVKTAATLDGRIATSTGDSKWITTDESRLRVHQLRSEYQCIVVGKGTVLADDPLLTCRLPAGGRNPIRLVIDSDLSLPLNRQVFRTADATTWVACTERAAEPKIAQLTALGAEVLVVPSADSRVSLQSLWPMLFDRGIGTCLVEGGGQLIGSLLREQLVDKWMNFINPKLVGGSGPTAITGFGVPLMKDAYQLQDVEVERSGNDIVVTGKLTYGEGNQCSQG